MYALQNFKYNVAYVHSQIRLTLKQDRFEQRSKEKAKMSIRKQWLTRFHSMHIISLCHYCITVGITFVNKSTQRLLAVSLREVPSCSWLCTFARPFITLLPSLSTYYTTHRLSLCIGILYLSLVTPINIAKSIINCKVSTLLI